MKRKLNFVFWWITLVSMAAALTACNTDRQQMKPTVNSTRQNQIHGNVMTLAAHSTKRTALPALHNASRLPSIGPLPSPYGFIRVSTANRTMHPLVITLVHGKQRTVIYADKSNVLKQLLAWQMNGRYILLNIGEPDPNLPTADFAGHAVVVDIVTHKVVDNALIPEESQRLMLCITATNFVWQWYYFLGGQNRYGYVTHLTNLKTGKQVTLQSKQYYPLGTELYPKGNTVYFVGRGGIYFVDIPSDAWSWSRRPSNTWYQVVLKPAVSLTNRAING